MRLLLAVLLFGVAAGQLCTVSEWGAWTEWRQPTHDNSITSSPALPDDPDIPDDEDIGRNMMGLLMDIHTEKEMYKSECLTDGSCPHLEYKKSEGFMPCENGYSNETYPCWNIDQMSFMDFDDLFVDFDEDRTPSGNDIWGWYDADEGEEYALMGTTSGVSLVRVTDPYNPHTVGFIRSHISQPLTWRDIKVIGNFAYIVSENLDHGIQIFDLTRLRGRTTPDYLDPDTRYDRVGNCHNIVANPDTHYVYGVGCTYGNRTEYELCRGGLHAVDVSDPLNPQYAGCFGEDRYTHDAQCVIYNGPDVNYQGREVCFCFNEDTFTIVDVENKPNMTMISKHEYETARYTHQGWITEDHTVALLNDELDEFYVGNQTTDEQTKSYIWDIQDLSAPVLMNTYIAPHQSIDHNEYIIADLTYMANYESGVRIMRIDQQAFTLTEVAYFDVFPSRTTAHFFGSWSVYPYLPSRNLIVSSIDYGMFVLRPNYDIIDNPANDVSSVSERSRYREILETDSADTCPHLAELQRR